MTLIKNSRNTPKVMRSLAMLAVQQMSVEEMDRALALARRVAPLVEVGDKEGIRSILRESGLPPEVLEAADGLMAHGIDHSHD
jgi:hypothetical protein